MVTVIACQDSLDTGGKKSVAIIQGDIQVKNKTKQQNQNQPTNQKVLVKTIEVRGIPPFNLVNDFVREPEANG